MVASKETFPLLAELLAGQQRLDTPVARFSSAHDQLAPDVTAIAPQLIPLSAPRPGEQYAFEVALDSCTGCKACVSACHSLNGLDDTETWRDVGLLVSDDRHHPFTQTVTTACHHCADPACLNGCPVLAYEKDPVTGIVRHLDDQCIGCNYCVLKCPYDVPKYNARLGIVRKCDMCHDRLAHGEAPACAQACPTSAIRIVTVTTTAAANGAPRADTTAFLPAAPAPDYTQPTTRYVSRRALPSDLVAADHATLRPQPPHWPLVALLTLMPMAVGCGVVDRVLSWPTAALVLVGWSAGAAGLALSVLHLGQPRRAWRVFLGWRASWLSREALVFGAWFLLATGYTAMRVGWLAAGAAALGPTLGIATAALGTLGLFCSVMVYVDTRRAFWRFANTAPRILGTAIVLGLACALACGAPGRTALPGAPRALGLLLAIATVLKLAFEARTLGPLANDRNTSTPELRTALLLVGSLRTVNELRLFAAAIGGVLFPLAVALKFAPPPLAWGGLALALLGEVAERYLFFRIVDAPKMPGVGA